MNLSSVVPYRVERYVTRTAHQIRVKNILATRPITTGGSDLLFVSQLCHADILPYLVAIKTIHDRVGHGGVMIIDDGSITADDRRILETHVRGVRVVGIDTVDTGCCPRGGTWERLLTILDLSSERYVVQVDADLLATGPLEDVVDAVAHNRAFTLCGGHGDDVVLSAATMADKARAGDADHIQDHAERLLDQCPELASSSYIRGCSGFAGFPRTSEGRRRAILLSTEMERRLGGRWRAWGSEQVCSNFVIANYPDPLPLPWPKYMSFYPGNDPSRADLLHFYGTHRFFAGHYTRLSRQAIEGLG
jgi:hypothetical protein